MKTKAFVVLLAVVLALGVSLGGAFAGGVALGKTQGEKAGRSTLPTRSTTTQGSGQQQSPGQFTPEQMQQFRQQFQGQAGQGDTQGRIMGGGLAGTVEKIEGNTVTVKTAQGTLQATISANTAIQKVSRVAIADVKTGSQVTIVGQRQQDGTVLASSILITPEGSQGIFGGRQQPGGQSP